MYLWLSCGRIDALTTVNKSRADHKRTSPMCLSSPEPGRAVMSGATEYCRGIVLAIARISRSVPVALCIAGVLGISVHGSHGRVDTFVLRRQLDLRCGSTFVRWPIPRSGEGEARSREPRNANGVTRWPLALRFVDCVYAIVISVLVRCIVCM